MRVVDVAEGVLGLEWIDGIAVRVLLPGGSEEEVSTAQNSVELRILDVLAHFVFQCIVTEAVFELYNAVPCGDYMITTPLQRQHDFSGLASVVDFLGTLHVLSGWPVLLEWNVRPLT